MHPSWDPEIPTGCAAGPQVLSREAPGPAQWEVVGLGEASERPGKVEAALMRNRVTTVLFMPLWMERLSPERTKWPLSRSL